MLALQPPMWVVNYGSRKGSTQGHYSGSSKHRGEGGSAHNEGCRFPDHRRGRRKFTAHNRVDQDQGIENKIAANIATKVNRADRHPKRPDYKSRHRPTSSRGQKLQPLEPPTQQNSAMPALPRRQLKAIPKSHRKKNTHAITHRVLKDKLTVECKMNDLASYIHQSKTPKSTSRDATERALANAVAKGNFFPRRGSLVLKTRENMKLHMPPAQTRPETRTWETESTDSTSYQKSLLQLVPCYDPRSAIHGVKLMGGSRYDRCRFTKRMGDPFARNTCHP